MNETVERAEAEQRVRLAEDHRNGYHRHLRPNICRMCFPGESAGLKPTQAQTLEWVKRRWPDRVDPEHRAMKLGEEAGEVLGAVIKIGEGRKTVDDLAMELAQVTICAMACAESAGIDLDAAVGAEWDRLQDREW